MSTSKTEKTAVRKIGKMIDSCAHLEGFFSENDKTTFTDGHIDISNDASGAKRSFGGRVNVQIKGRKVNAKAADLNSYPVSVVDLRGFVTLAGLLFFVVDIDKKSNKKYPKYVLLKPFYIHDLLSKAKPGQKTISVRLKRLPSDEDRMEAIIALALASRQEKIVENPSNYLYENMESITVKSAEPLNRDKLAVYDGSSPDHSIIIRTGDGIEQFVNATVEIIPPNMQFHQANYNVSCNGVVCDNVLHRNIDDEHIELKIGKGITLRLQKLAIDAPGSVTVEFQDSLPERLKDIEFFLGVLQANTFFINEEPVVLKINSNRTVADLKDEAGVLRQLVEIANHFNIDPSLIRIGEITEKQFWQLDIVYRTAVKGEYVKNLEVKDETRLILQPFGRWNLALIAHPGDVAGEWTYHEVISKRHHFAMTPSTDRSDSSIERVTPYELIDNRWLPSVLNLHLDKLVDFYSALEETVDVDNLATWMVLRLIKAADSEQSRKTAFLIAAQALNDWLVERDREESPIYRLNGWQILYRQTGLLDSQRTEIRSFRHNLDQTMHPDNYSEIMIGCALLLDDREEANFLLTQLSVDRRAVFNEWPIAQLMTGALKEEIEK